MFFVYFDLDSATSGIVFIFFLDNNKSAEEHFFYFFFQITTFLSFTAKKSLLTLEG